MACLGQAIDMDTLVLLGCHGSSGIILFSLFPCHCAGQVMGRKCDLMGGRMTFCSTGFKNVSACTIYIVQLLLQRIPHWKNSSSSEANNESLGWSSSLWLGKDVTMTIHMTVILPYNAVVCNVLLFQNIVYWLGLAPKVDHFEHGWVSETIQKIMGVFTV